MALSASRALDIRNGSGKTRRSYVVLTGAKIYKHALVGITEAGKAKVCADSTTLKFLGLAEAECATGDGTITVTVLNNLEALLPTQTGNTIGHLMATKFYAVDDQTATIKTTLGPMVGTMVDRVTANTAWIYISMGVGEKGA